MRLCKDFDEVMKVCVKMFLSSGLYLVSGDSMKTRSCSLILQCLHQNVFLASSSSASKSKASHLGPAGEVTFLFLFVETS